MMAPNDTRAQKTAVIVAIAVLSVVAVATFVVVSGGPTDPNNQSHQTTVGKADSTVETTETKITATIPPTPTATAIPIATPTPTPTETSSPTPTATSTPNPYDDDKYSDFVASMYAEAEADTTIPLRIRAHSVVKGKILVIAMNLSAPSNGFRRGKQINRLITSGYAQAVANHDRGYIDGKIPNRLRIAEVNNTGAAPKTLYVNTSLARKYYTSQIDVTEFADRYWETKRNMTAPEIRSTREMDRIGGNVTLYNESAG